MGIVRVAPGQVGRLVRVRLDQVDFRHREMTARRLRDQRWNEELRPDVGYSPTMPQRLRALADAVELERAVIAPERVHLVPETAVDVVLARHGVEVVDAVLRRS